MIRTASGRARRGVMGAASIFAAAGICVPPADAKSRSKPDLVVKAFVFTSSPPHAAASIKHVVMNSDGEGEFGIAYKVKNVGHRRSNSSIARVVISGRRVAEEAVGPIRPGHTRTFRQSYSRKFHTPGHYEAFVCADFGDRINESNEHNNCTANVGFQAIPRRWNVSTFTTGPNSLTGIAPFDSAHSVRMHFDFEGIISENGEHHFLWLATGEVTGDSSGNDGTCSYKGHGAVSHSPWDVIEPNLGYLEITPEADQYFAEVLDQDYGFVTTTTCPPYPTSTSTGGLGTLQTVASDGTPEQPMSPRTRTLVGNYNIPTDIGHGSTIGQWSFKADVP